ncbi:MULTISPECIES: type VII secretion-associated serine protease mycosin [Streptomyces]|uniref:Type VII secretion-associated serine protease mycosin n=1 Tax=Streptomyces melanosporofaciens TaxID=67327 RepID=A0A1H4UL13_STRMJ|nr:type VII secretion-associated serine protease mycosin [Streptomyces melanosporofaciens]SEC69592.1 type VII secretion-associated serine protease mycosin [Streptomyces melanosporofaciens]
MPLQKYGARRRSLSALATLGAGLMAVSGIAPAAAAQDISSQQWYLKDMQADGMWKVSKGRGITVAVIDTGVDASLPELRGRVLDGIDASDKATDPTDDPNGHGTSMAGIIAGTGKGGGIQGLAPEAKILPVKASLVEMKSESVGSVMAKAIKYSVDHGAKVLNISLGVTGLPGYFSKTQNAVNYALKKGALIFAATGNAGDKENHSEYPSVLPGVVGVGAIDRTGKVAKFSTTGDQVGLVAVGDQIPVRCKDSESVCMTRGTSDATAITSASAALIWSKHPKWTNNQVLRVMMQTAAKPKTGDVPSSYVGYGSVRPRKVLLDGEGDPGPANTNPLLAREGATKPKPSESASKAAGDASQPPASDKQAAEKPAAEAKASDDGGNTTLWVALGAGVVVVAGAAVAFTVVRRRGGTMARP